MFLRVYNKNYIRIIIDVNFLFVKVIKIIYNDEVVYFDFLVIRSFDSREDEGREGFRIIGW